MLSWGLVYSYLARPAGSRLPAFSSKSTMRSFKFWAWIIVVESEKGCKTVISKKWFGKDKSVPKMATASALGGCKKNINNT